jgi:hypothetical protein
MRPSVSHRGPVRRHALQWQFRVTHWVGPCDFVRKTGGFSQSSCAGDRSPFAPVEEHCKSLIRPKGRGNAALAIKPRKAALPPITPEESSST